MALRNKSCRWLNAMVWQSTTNTPRDLFPLLQLLSQAPVQSHSYLHNTFEGLGITCVGEL